MILPPIPSLSPYISHYKFTRLNAGDCTFLPATITPMLVLFKHGAVASRLDFSTTVILPRAYIEGPVLRPRDSVALENSFIVSIHFKPQSLAYFFRVFTNELVNQVVQLEDLCKRHYVQILEHLDATDDISELKYLLDNWLTLLFLERSAHVKLLPRNITAGQLDIDEITRHLGIGRRQFERLFKHNYGVTYAEWRKLRRVEYALLRIAKCKTKQECFGDVAMDAGYYDQSHMIRDFKRYCGMAPSSLKGAISSSPSFWPLRTLSSI